MMCVVAVLTLAGTQLAVLQGIVAKESYCTVNTLGVGCLIEAQSIVARMAIVNRISIASQAGAMTRKA